MYEDIEVFIDWEDDILVIVKDSGMYAYRASQEMELYEKMLALGATESVLHSEDSEYFREMIEKDEELQKKIEELEYELYSQGV